MGAKEEMGALLIRNSDAVFKSYDLMEKIDENFLRFFKAAMPHILEEVLPGWAWEYSNLRAGKIASFWPASWEYPEEQYAFFEIVLFKETRFWLSCLTGDGGKMGIAFRFNPNLFGMRKAQAQQLKQDFYFKNVEKLYEPGFHQTMSPIYKYYNENFDIYHPLRLNVDVIADEYPDWSTRTLLPFKECLGDIKGCFPVFDKFVLEIAGPNPRVEASSQA